MITYRYAEIELENEECIFIELLDYEQEGDVFDTIVYNNPSFRYKNLLMCNKSIIPSDNTFRGTVTPLMLFIDNNTDLMSLKWYGPFNLYL